MGSMIAKSQVMLFARSLGEFKEAGLPLCLFIGVNMQNPWIQQDYRVDGVDVTQKMERN